MPQFGASLTDDSRIVIYDRNMFIVQSTEQFKQARVFTIKLFTAVIYGFF